MIKIQYIGETETYDSSFGYASNNVVRLIGEFPIKAVGFKAYSRKDAEIGCYSEYKYIYRTIDGGVEFTNDENNVYVEPVIPEPEPEPEPYVPTEEEVKAMLLAEFEFAKSSKISEMSYACEQAIYTGVSVNGKHYSYTMQDQANLLNAVTLAKETGMSMPYHADGESCSMYALDELHAIYIAEQGNITKNQTYFNQLKLYINSITDVSELENVREISYGYELTGAYLEAYENIMTQAQAVINTLTAVEQ